MEPINVSVISNNRCTGCNSCIAACSRNALKTEIDDNGFWRVKVENDRCINCGLCIKACPIYSRTFTTFNEPIAFSAWNKDNYIRYNSSSGGIFSALAKNILDAGGVVYGAAYRQDFMVEHIRIDSINQLDLLRGSKYVQSYISDEIFKKLRKDIKERQVLFSGTPCQTGAVIKYLETFDNTIPETVLLVDVLCHGVPSPKCWKEYIFEKETSHGAKLIKVNMRDKSKGWHRFHVRLQYNNDKEEVESFHNGIWGPSYFTNLFLRESCYQCEFKEKIRKSDITLGDFWGAAREEALKRYDDNDKGTSVILANSEKGMKALHNLKNCYIESIKYDCLLNGLYVLYRSSNRNVFRKQAFKRLGKETYSKIVSCYTHPSLVKRIKRKGYQLLQKIFDLDNGY